VLRFGVLSPPALGSPDETTHSQAEMRRQTDTRFLTEGRRPAMGANYTPEARYGSMATRQA